MQIHEKKSILNAPQLDAVRHTEGPLLILAGAGSGKTKVLTHRIARIIEKGIAPQNILAVTFTNKAADEMKKRIGHLLTGAHRTLKARPWIGTFHALGGFILRREARHVGLPKQFSIFDEEDALSLIKESIKELALDPKQFQPTRVRSFISQKKGELIDNTMFEKDAGEHYYTKIMAQIWKRYALKLQEQKAVDFDDLLLYPVTIFQNNPDALKTYQKLWTYIHIDEYQDTNHAQYVLANLLAQSHRNICVVGDVDQCVYSWRGADFRNILSFENDWTEARLITLEENYRSTSVILDAANAVIEKNTHRKPKKLFTKKQKGEKMLLAPAPDEGTEAIHVISTIKTLHENGTPLKEIAVLMRTNFQSRVLEEAFIEADIPYHLTGVKFFNRKEIKDILAYVRVALNPQDLVSLKRILNVPPRGIGPALVLKIIAHKPLRPHEQERKDSFFKLLKTVRTAVVQTPPSKALASIIKKTGYWNLWTNETEEGAMRIANIKELVSLGARYDSYAPEEGMTALLENAALMSEQDTIKESNKVVHIMTVHAAKGLEFDYVFLVGLEDGLFPHTALAAENEEMRGEEERRLFYVALTRARKKIIASFALVRTIFGEKRINSPSRFLSDIPGHLVELQNSDTTIDYDV